LHVQYSATDQYLIPTNGIYKRIIIYLPWRQFNFFVNNNFNFFLNNTFSKRLNGHVCSYIADLGILTLF